MHPPNSLSRSRSTFVFAIGGITFAAVALLVPLPLKSRLAAVIGDFVHAPFFAGLTLFALLLWQRFRPIRSINRWWLMRIAVVAISLVAFGVMIELLQANTGRSPTRHDAIANAFGVLVASVLCFAFLIAKYERRYAKAVWPLVLLAFCLLGFAWQRPASIIIDMIQARRAFPLLSSFESEVELSRWHFDHSSGGLTNDHVSHGQHALRWEFHDSDHPSVTLVDTYSDWSRVLWVELEATLNPKATQSLDVVLKVIDQHHRDYHSDIAQKEFRLSPGVTHRLAMRREEMVVGSNGRDLDLQKVKFVSLLALDPPEPAFIDIDHLRMQLDETP